MVVLRENHVCSDHKRSDCRRRAGIFNANLSTVRRRGYLGSLKDKKGSHLRAFFTVYLNDEQALHLGVRDRRDGRPLRILDDTKTAHIGDILGGLGGSSEEHT